MTEPGLDETMHSEWHPIGRSDDAPPRHVYQAKLIGRELAVWRADDGHLNVWENRCLHRGVRLSIGLNEGTELRCLYHGWRYSNRTGGCTYIPAHPADAPARTLFNRTFPSFEQYGLMWTTELGDGEPPRVAALDSGSPFPLRSLPFRAPAGEVLRLLGHYRFRPSDRLEATGEVSYEIAELGPLATQLTAAVDDSLQTLVLIVQPVDSGECVVHGVLADAPSADRHIAVLRHHATELERIRGRAEAAAAEVPSPAPIEAVIERLAPRDQAPPTVRTRQDAELRVVVDRKWETATGVAAFALAPIEGFLPTAQPGAHIDVHLPNGLVRQYSLTNCSGDQARYVIGVKLEPESTGGSSCLHHTVREGDVLAISAPRNNFSLRRDAVRTVLIAGGIGITPLLSMAETLKANRLPFQLHYFAQSVDHMAFGDRLDLLGDGLIRHLGLGPAETGNQLDVILATYGPDSHTYICGPGPMLDATRSAAATAGWPDAAVHFEYFKNTTDVDRSTRFRVSLARSALTLEVPAGESILEVLRANGVALPSSCEQGACGTCVVGVISGDPIHQDVYLRPSEREAGDRIATCVSRSSSDELVLDL